jgi:hypothetical protein
MDCTVLYYTALCRAVQEYFCDRKSFIDTCVFTLGHVMDEISMGHEYQENVLTAIPISSVSKEEIMTSVS